MNVPSLLSTCNSPSEALNTQRAHASAVNKHLTSQFADRQRVAKVVIRQLQTVVRQNVALPQTPIIPVEAPRAPPRRAPPGS
jgi:hypothetical protein